jgi:hypothetical protein
MSMVTACFVFRGQMVQDVPVLNPGSCGGRAWLLVLDTSHQPDLFVVEAESPTAALDVLADDEEHGHLVRIQDHEMGDYGYRLPAGAVVGGVALQQEATVNLRGEVVPQDQAEYLREPSVTGSGICYDGECLLVYGDEQAKVPFTCTYHGEGLPDAGISPPEYATSNVP